MRIKLLILTFFYLFIGANPVFAVTIKINEFYAAGSTSSNPDWVEIYNDGADISEYQLRDSSINNKKDLAGSTCSGNYCTIDWYNYLNNSGDTIKLVLKTAIDSPIDQVAYGSNGDISVPTAGQSAVRNPDGTGDWVISSTPTKSAPNIAFVPPTPSPTPTSVPTPTPTPSPSPTSNPSSTPSPTPKAKTATNTVPKNTAPSLNPATPLPTIQEAIGVPQPIKPSAKIQYHIASVAAAVASVAPSAKVEVKNQKQANPFLWAGITFIFAGVSSLGYIYLKRHGKIFNTFR